MFCEGSSQGPQLSQIEAEDTGVIRLVVVDGVEDEVDLGETLVGGVPLYRRGGLLIPWLVTSLECEVIWPVTVLAPLHDHKVVAVAPLIEVHQNLGNQA